MNVRTRMWRLSIATLAGLSTTFLVVTPAEARDPAHDPFAKAPPGSTVLVEGGSVTVISSLTGGRTGIAIYRAASGETGVTLHSKLKAAGVVGDQGFSALVEPYRCTTAFGGAAHLGNSNCTLKYRWKHNGFSRPQVYFRDHTPSRWPVKASVTEWNKSDSIDSWHTGSSCPTGGRHCVHVWNADYGRTWAGKVYMEVDSSGYFIDGSVVVHFNDYWSGEDNRGNTCHELGHALGLAHNTEPASCMYGMAQAGPDPIYPATNDYRVLTFVLYN